MPAFENKTLSALVPNLQTCLLLPKLLQKISSFQAPLFFCICDLRKKCLQLFVITYLKCFAQLGKLQIQSSQDIVTNNWYNLQLGKDFRKLGSIIITCEHRHNLCLFLWPNIFSPPKISSFQAPFCCICDHPKMFAIVVTQNVCTIGGCANSKISRFKLTIDTVSNWKETFANLGLW